MNLLAVARAHSAIGYGTVYALGQGGKRADAPHPGHECDCSGFIAWVFGTPRKVPTSIGWIETSRIAKDATGKRLLFQRVYDPEPGDIVVFGDWTDATGRRRQGHVGILSEVPAEKGPFWWDGLRVIHCSSGNSKNGDAIAQTDAKVFRNRAIFARWIGA